MRLKTVTILALLLASCSTGPEHCSRPPGWISPATGSAIPDPLPKAGLRSVVLLGERHDSAPDHRWQLAAIEQLAAGNPDLVLGFEMFPRKAQPALDDWVAGRLSEADFLARTDWAHNWGQDPELYLPIFRFARDRQIPMVALNVDRALPHRIAKEGWSAIPPAEREGVGDPAPATPAYRARLEEAMGGHEAMGGQSLDRFIDAQLAWDRAMAEGIAAIPRSGRRRLVVAIMGSGHLENRDGVPYQLRALGIADAAIFLPLDGAERCAPLDPGLADAVYLTGD